MLTRSKFSSGVLTPRCGNRWGCDAHHRARTLAGPVPVVHHRSHFQIPGRLAKRPRKQAYGIPRPSVPYLETLERELSVVRTIIRQVSYLKTTEGSNRRSWVSEILTHNATRIITVLWLAIVLLRKVDPSILFVLVTAVITVVLSITVNELARKWWIQWSTNDVALYKQPDVTVQLGRKPTMEQTEHLSDEKLAKLLLRTNDGRPYLLQGAFDSPLHRLVGRFLTTESGQFCAGLQRRDKLTMRSGLLLGVAMSLT